MTDPKTNGEGKGDANKPPFKSTLTQGKQRFLSFVIEHALEVGRRTSADFIRHFPPDAIMKGLEHQPSIRASILVLTTGLKQKIAIKKSWQSAAEDLQISLDEGETDAESIVAVFKPDDRVRYLDSRKLWSFIVEGEFWKAQPGKKPDFERAKQHVAFMIDRALQDGLLTHRDLVEGITVAELAQRMPKADLGRIIERALANSHKNAPFTEVDLFDAVTAPVLVDHVPLEHIWNNLIMPKVAEVHGYLESREPQEVKEGKRGKQQVQLPPEEITTQFTVPPESGRWLENRENAGAALDEALTVSDDDIRID